jgi:predicted Fe-Mo cluster-binding NifX family protein
MKVAVTVWEERISPVFDVCREALIMEIDKGRILSTVTEKFENPSPFKKIERLVQLGVETLICGAISESLNRDLADRKVEVIGFIAGPVDEVIQAFLSKSLPNAALYMPGYCGGQKRRRSRRSSKGGRRRQRGRFSN